MLILPREQIIVQPFAILKGWKVYHHHQCYLHSLEGARLTRIGLHTSVGDDDGVEN